MIRNINIGMRSALAFGVICIFLLGVSTFSIYKIGEINATIDVLTLERMRRVTLASELRKQTLLSRVRVAQLTEVKTLSETNVTGSKQTSSTSLELANLAESLNVYT